MNLASFYLCLFMNINTSANPLWNAIINVGKEHNYKYLVACTCITLGSDLLFLFFFFLQVCFWTIYDKKLKFYSATSCATTITWKSKKNQ